MEHGKRYTKEEKKEILRFRETHTFQETSDKFGVSMMTLFRWSRPYQSNLSVTEKMLEMKKMELKKRSVDVNLIRIKDKTKLPEIENMLEILQFLDGLKGMALINDEGRFVALYTTDNVKEEALYMTNLSLLEAAQSTCEHLIGGSVETIMIKSNVGLLLISGAGPHLVLILLFDDRVNFKRVFNEDFTVIERVKQTLENKYQI
jgi:predicted regulator of Ras-like GTPase activity (Roadblock/LC7/MglB family)